MVKQLRLQLFIDETRKNEWKVFGRKTTSGIEGYIRRLSAFTPWREAFSHHGVLRSTSLG